MGQKAVPVTTRVLTLRCTRVWVEAQVNDAKSYAFLSSLVHALCTLCKSLAAGQRVSDDRMREITAAVKKGPFRKL